MGHGAFFAELAFLDSVLPPVAFYEDPAATAMNPVMCCPMRARMRRTVPATGNPDVAGSVPALIAVDPHEAALRRWGTALDDGRRRANANHNLRKGSRRRQTEG
jgi:hypothetical protein